MVFFLKKEKMLARLSFIFAFFLCIFSGFSAVEELERPLPTTRVPSLSEQENLFVKAYQEIGVANIDPTTTPIPGLAEMVKVHYSFTRGIVEESPFHLELLRSFWPKASKIIEENRLTIAQMKLMAWQLSFLITDFQKHGVRGATDLVGLRAECNKVIDVEDQASIWVLYHGPEGGWQNIENYKDSDQYVRGWKTGFEFPAVLAAKNCNFSYDRFCRNYLERDFVLHLDGLSFLPPGAGPHAGEHHLSSDFLKHDFSHEHDFRNAYSWPATGGWGYEGNAAKEWMKNPQTQGLDYWQTLRSLLRKIYEAGRTSGDARLQTMNNIGIFWLLHQEAMKMTGNVQLPYLGEEEGLPFSERRLFLSVVESVSRKQETPEHAMDFLLTTYIPWDFYADYKMPVHTKFVGYKEKEEGALALRFAISAFHEGKLKENLGHVWVDFHLAPEVEEGKVKPHLSNASSIEWSTESDFLKSNEKEEIQTMTQGWGERYTVASQLKRESLEIRYGIIYSDYERALRDLYGSELFPSEEMSVIKRTEGVAAGQNRFWKEFYHANKHLFSTAPLEHNL